MTSSLRRFVRVLAFGVAVSATASTSFVPAGAQENQPAAPPAQPPALAPVDAMTASVAEVRAAVNAVDAAVAYTQQELDRATRAAAEAEERAQAAEGARREAAREERLARRRTVKMAAAMYVHGPRAANNLLGASDINEALRWQEAADAVAGAQADVVTASARARRAAERAESRERSSAAAARDAVGQLERQAAELLAQQEQRRALLGAVEQRLERALAEAEALATINADLAADLAARDAALWAIAPGGAAAPGRVVVRPSPATVVVRGIRVAAVIAPQLDAMLAAALAAGVPLGGGGYRDPINQIALRIQNCGPTAFDIYEKPASACTPPTARPGTSMHESGLAVDFTSGGRAITSEVDPAFQWLAANAATFGLANLPGEPWHWSTTGN